MAHPPRGFTTPGAADASGDYLTGVYDEPARPATGADTAASEEVARVVDVAVELFADQGYSATKLEAVSKTSGMSKRMIHYHFADKKGLYKQAIDRAFERLVPPADVLERTSTVPVEGMRRFVDALFYRFQDNPDAVALLLRENLDGVLTPAELASLGGRTEVVLHTERLLLLGQDSGAFRPGISAADVLALVSSICVFRIGSRHTSLQPGQMTLTNQRNTEGLRRMTIDTVLGFLTSNIPDSGYASYLEPDVKPKRQSSEPDDAYAIEEPELY